MIEALTALIGHDSFANDFSGVVRVTLDHDTVVERAFGYADRSRKRPNRLDTRFGLASGTKLLTALTVGTLIDEGRVSLDSSLAGAVATDLPGISPAATVHQVLSHTSGVHDYYDEELIEDFDTFEMEIPPTRLLGPRDYLPMILGRPMKFDPGARFSYSNSGYVLLGLLIEELAGCAFQDAVTDRVLKRCGMTDSGFFRFDRLPDDTALGYTGTGDGAQTNAHLLPIIGGPDGGAFSTAGDIQRLWSRLFDATVLSPALTRAFLTRTADARPGLGYGCGVWIEDEGDGPRSLFIEGSDAGVSFRSTCHSTTAIATVISNTSDGAWPVHRAIDEILRRDLPPGTRGFAFSRSSSRSDRS